MAEALESGQPDGRPYDKHASVPVVATLVKTKPGSSQIGLFNECLDLACPGIEACDRCLDVAVAGFRPVWRDAEHDDGTRSGFVNGLLHGNRKCLWVSDDVV